PEGTIRRRSVPPSCPGFHSMLDARHFPARAAAAVALLLCLDFWAANARDARWHEVVPGVLRSEGCPSAYALIEGRAALLVGAPPGASLAALKDRGGDRCEIVLLAHHDRDSCVQAGDWAAAGIPIRAPRNAETFLTPEGVRAYWKTALPAE